MSKKTKFSDLNESQLEAVEQLDGPVMVVAGAGSGKTGVVTYRIVNLINHGVASYRILGLTFTNKAAEEMNERVRNLTNCNVLICTFHSLGARILRESAEVLGYQRSFTIYDEEDAQKLLKDCLQSASLKKGEIKAIRSMISKVKNEMVDPASLELGELPDTVAKHFLNAYSLYQARLKESGAMDFDDLLYLTVKLFKEHPDVLEMYHNRWSHLLIDEYQDTNQAQYLMVKMLAEKQHNLCVVGDPDQSIYSWRGATIDNILSFEKDYLGAIVVRLEQNYRSTSNILDAANALIERNEGRLPKKLWSGLGEGQKIQVYRALDEREEAAFVVEQVRRLQREGVAMNEMVVFYRTNFQSRTFEDAFLFNGIPYVIVGGISFYQRKEIKDILALLRIAEQGADHIAFVRTISMAKRGIGSATIDKLRESAIREGMTIADYCKSLVEDKALNYSVKLPARQKNALKEYVNFIWKLKAMAMDSPVHELVRAAIYDSGYLSVLKQDPESYEDRLMNVDELVSKAAEWEEYTEEATLSAFLSELALKTNLDEAGSHEDSLKLMTIHNGKGLEFDITFLVGMEEDLFPHINSKDSPKALEEERRLCYVGITRAKKLLFMTHASRRYMWGMLRPMRRSRFLSEIPKHYID